MLRTAVCDDEREALQKIEAAIHRAGGGFQTVKYLSALSLCEDVESGRLFDIVLLDVEMPELSGLEAAKRIRAACPSAAILFLTSHTEFPLVKEGYKVGALRYVCKLEMETALPEALSAAAASCREKASAYLTLTWRSTGVRVPLSEIRTIRRTGRTLEIDTEKQGRLYDPRSLKDMLETLGDSRFLYASRNTAVNLDQVQKLTKTGLVMKNGEEVAVSRKLLPQVKAAILRVWGQAE